MLLGLGLYYLGSVRRWREGSKENRCYSLRGLVRSKASTPANRAKQSQASLPPYAAPPRAPHPAQAMPSARFWSRDPQHQTPTLCGPRSKGPTQRGREARRPLQSPPEAQDGETRLRERNSNCPLGLGTAQAHISARGTLLRGLMRFQVYPGPQLSGARGGAVVRGRTGEKAGLGWLGRERLPGQMPLLLRAVTGDFSRSPNPDSPAARAKRSGDQIASLNWVSKLATH